MVLYLQWFNMKKALVDLGTSGKHQLLAEKHAAVLCWNIHP